MTTYISKDGKLMPEFVPEDVFKEALPEQYLLAAVLERGMLDALGICADLISKGMRESATMMARRWLRSKDTSPFSFVWICEELDLSPDVIRQVINNVRDINEENFMAQRIINQLQNRAWLKAYNSKPV